MSVKDPGMDKSGGVRHTMDTIKNVDEGLGYKVGGKHVTAAEFDPREITKFDRYTETIRMHQMNVEAINPGDEPEPKGNIEHGAPIG